MFYATLIIMSWKYFFDFRSPQLYNFGLEVSPLKCELGSQASPLQFELRSGSSAFRGTYREWLGPKISKSKFKKYFLETTLLYVSCYPDHFEPKIFFRCSSKVKIFSNKIKVFLETTFVHVSCYPDHYEPKIFFRFSKYATTLRYTILDSRFPSLKCDLGSQASPLQHELGSGSSRYRRYVSRMNRTENFSKFFWKPLFSTIHATLITMSRN